VRDDFPQEPMPSLDYEIALIELFGQTRVIGITLNHEHMTDDEITQTIDRYRRDYALPVTDALTRPRAELADMVIASDPSLGRARDLALGLP
jgi:uncharacterized NAD-dependent epimerase/dehydratase family protein